MFLYPLSEYNNSPEYDYTTLVSDLRVYCGNLYNAQQALLGVTNSPVYLYRAYHCPSTPFPSGGWNRLYAFHTWDYVSIISEYPDGFEPSFADLMFGQTLRDSFIELAYTGI